MANRCKVTAQTLITFGGLKVEGQDEASFEIARSGDITIKGELKVNGVTKSQIRVKFAGEGIVQLERDVVVKNAVLDLSKKDLKLEESASVTARGKALIVIKAGTDISRWSIGRDAGVLRGWELVRGSEEVGSAREG